jgi:hypothetical protein
MTNTQATRRCKNAILDHVRRYTIGVENVLVKSVPGDVVKCVRRLVSARQLRECNHPRGFRYLTLFHRPTLSEKAFVRRYAVACFCESPGSRRSLLIRAEIERYFPNIFRHGMPGGYYVDSSDERPRFGHVRVDVAPARTDRILSRAVNLIERHMRNSGIRQLIAQRQFEITFIVATLQKARRLHTEFRKLDQSGVAVHAHAVPELLELIAPITTDNSVGGPDTASGFGV